MYAARRLVAPKNTRGESAKDHLNFAEAHFKRPQARFKTRKKNVARATF
jgi:hypothetical protein